MERSETIHSNRPFFILNQCRRKKLLSFLEQEWDKKGTSQESREEALPIILQMLSEPPKNAVEEKIYADALGIKDDPMQILVNFGLGVQVMNATIKPSSVPPHIQLDEEFWNEYEGIDEVMKVANYFRTRINEWTS